MGGCHIFPLSSSLSCIFTSFHILLSFFPTKIFFLTSFMSCQPSFCLCQVIKLGPLCPCLCKSEVCCSCVSQHLAVLCLIRSNIDLFFPKTCKVLFWLPQSIFQAGCPPHHGAFGKLNFQLMLSFVKCSCNCSLLLICFNHLPAGWKDSALSE